MSQKYNDLKKEKTENNNEPDGSSRAGHISLKTQRFGISIAYEMPSGRPLIAWNVRRHGEGGSASREQPDRCRLWQAQAHGDTRGRPRRRLLPGPGVWLGGKGAGGRRLLLEPVPSSHF